MPSKTAKQHRAMVPLQVAGLRRSNADKRHAVEMAFNDPEYDNLSDREFGDSCRVSHTYVQKIRQQQNQAAIEKSGNVAKDENDSQQGDKDNKRPRKPKPTQAGVAENATDTEKSGNVSTNDAKINIRLV